jgi:ABC-type transporter Mla subunit MlaD
MSDLGLLLLGCSVAISSIALLVHAIASIRLARTAAKLYAEISPLIPQASETLRQAQSTLAETAHDVREVTDRAKTTLDAMQAQIDQIDRARTELTTHVRAQGERVELVLDEIFTQVQEVVGMVHGSVLRPVREIGGLLAGVKAGVQALFGSHRPTVDRATHDEEMFI